MLGVTGTKYFSLKKVLPGDSSKYLAQWEKSLQNVKSLNPGHVLMAIGNHTGSVPEFYTVYSDAKKKGGGFG